MPIALFNRFVVGWPKPKDPERAAKWKDDTRCASYPVADILRARFPDDGHFTAYDADVPRRHTIALFHDPSNAGQIERVNLRMELAIFDIDHPDHAAPGFSLPAEWLADEEQKLLAFDDVHPDAFIYTTRGGYRIVLALPEPFPLRCQRDDDEWTVKYKSWCRHLRRRFDIHADEACADWTRLFRAPFVARDGVRQTPTTCGDPAKLGVWAPKLTKHDIAVPRPRTTHASYGTVAPIPLGDPNSAYARFRIEDAARYLTLAPLVCFATSGQSPPRRDAMFGIASYLVRRLRLDVDVAADIFEAVYNPRLIAAGMVPWSREEPGDYGMSIVERMEHARDTGSIPAGDLMPEDIFNLLFGSAA